MSVSEVNISSEPGAKEPSMQDGRPVWERAVRKQEALASEPFFHMVERVDIDTLLLLVDRRNGFRRPLSMYWGATGRSVCPSPPSSPA